MFCFSFFFFSSSFERELFWASHLDGNRSKLGKTKVPPDSCCFDVGLIRKPERQLPERLYSPALFQPAAANCPAITISKTDLDKIPAGRQNCTLLQLDDNGE